MNLVTRDGHTRSEWIDRCKECDWSCSYCNRKLTTETATKDHMTPKSWRLPYLDSIDNIAPSCIACNSEKGNCNILVYLLNRRGLQSWSDSGGKPIERSAKELRCMSRHDLTNLREIVLSRIAELQIMLGSIQIRGVVRGDAYREHQHLMCYLRQINESKKYVNTRVHDSVRLYSHTDSVLLLAAYEALTNPEVDTEKKQKLVDSIRIRLEMEK